MDVRTSRAADFQEIGHCGGKVTLTFRNGEKGRTYQIGYTGTSARGFMAMTAVYALPPGVAVGTIKLGGIGQPWNPAPFPGCFPVFIMSDSEGQFGHTCPACGKYWRSSGAARVCPYCAVRGDTHDFLSAAQLLYVRRYIEKLLGGLSDMTEFEIVIDLDAVADAVGKEGEKPEFYMSDESQQGKFICLACNGFNDILGRFGSCSSCGTRNDLAIFKEELVPAIRKRLNDNDPPEDCVRDAVSDFEIMLGKIAGELVAHVPMIGARATRLSQGRFHNITEVREQFREWFGFDIGAGLKDDDWAHVVLMFHRRHLYEHKGEVDQKYLDDSGDTSVRLGQVIREEKEPTHRLLGSLSRMAENLQRGFHELLPPLPEPIKRYEDERARLEAYRNQTGRPATTGS